MKYSSATFSPSLPIALLVLATAAVRVQAQETSRVNAGQALEVGQHVQVDVTRIGRVEGRFRTANGTALTLDRDDVPLEVRLPDIERLWSRGRATRRGALIGAGVGIISGILIGHGAVGWACQREEEEDPDPCTAADREALRGIVGIVFGAGGAVVGLGIGFAIPTWHLRFP